MTTYAQIIKDLKTALDKARAHTDSNLSPEGLRAQREKLHTDALANARAQFDALATPALTGLDKARENLARAEQTRDRGTAADRETTFRRLTMLLNTGRDLADLIETANPAELDALAEWAPTWVRAQSPVPGDLMERQHYTEPDTEWIGAAVLARRAATEPDPTVYRAVLDAETEAYQAKAWGAHLDAIEAGESPLEGALRNAIYHADNDGYRAVFQADTAGRA